MGQKFSDCMARINGVSMVVKFQANKSSFRTLDDVQMALHDAGLGQCKLVIGIDFTKSNLWSGENSFEGRSLHCLEVGKPKNPYLTCIDLIGECMSSFLDNAHIAAYGFGDARSRDTSVTPLAKDAPFGYCKGMGEVVAKYKEAARRFTLSGPTSFKPLIDQAIALAEKQRGYHVLFILCDGQVTHEKDTMDAIVRASLHPISIVCIGIGDGPWEAMADFDEKLPAREFDNFCFVNFTELQKEYPLMKDLMPQFALTALSEIPMQFYYIRATFSGEHPFGVLSAKEKRALKAKEEEQKKEKEREESQS